SASVFVAIILDITERKRVNEELLKRMHLAAFGADIGVALTEGDSLQNMLHKCTDTIIRHLDAAFARIWTLNKEENMLELQASAGMYTHIDGSHSHVPVGAFKIGLIAQELKPHLTNNVIDDPRISDREWARREGMVAFAGYPLIVEDNIVGVMGMFARKPLMNDTLDTLASMADMIALGIKRKRVEDALRESEEKSLLLLNSTGEAIYGLDMEGNCTFCNPSCLSMLGYEDESQLLGRNMHGLIHHTRIDGTPYPKEECCIYQAFREGKGTHVDDEV
ncbi:MAG: GAF domain-containing protein, partial [Gammaproteobacteria bacterium]|nr:GAF domain-containing protein [Gammaproteobacteria bacterium]